MIVFLFFAASKKTVRTKSARTSDLSKQQTHDTYVQRAARSSQVEDYYLALAAESQTHRQGMMFDIRVMVLLPTCHHNPEGISLSGTTLPELASQKACLADIGVSRVTTVASKTPSAWPCARSPLIFRPGFAIARVEF